MSESRRSSRHKAKPSQAVKFFTRRVKSEPKKRRPIQHCEARPREKTQWASDLGLGPHRFPTPPPPFIRRRNLSWSGTVLTRKTAPKLRFDPTVAWHHGNSNSTLLSPILALFAVGGHYNLHIQNKASQEDLTLPVELLYMPHFTRSIHSTCAVSATEQVL